jgi:hypothetical protein
MKRWRRSMPCRAERCVRNEATGARALAAVGQPSEANVLLAPLSNEFNFAVTAAEDLGTSFSSATANLSSVR